jgi:transcriptional regulator with XRE-family HTH domain
VPIRIEQTVARRVRHLRAQLGWSQQDLADRLANLGLPIDRSSLARLENENRGVGVDEAIALAYALNVAPVHLMVDTDDDAEPVAPVPGSEISPREARAWIRGVMPMIFQDPRGYFMNVPRAEFEQYQLGEQRKEEN